MAGFLVPHCLAAVSYTHLLLGDGAVVRHHAAELLRQGLRLGRRAVCQQDLAGGQLLSGRLDQGPAHIAGADKAECYHFDQPFFFTKFPCPAPVSYTHLYFTASTETPAGEVMTTTVGDQEVRIGKTDYILKSEYIEFSGGTIVDVTWEEPDPAE